MTRRTLSKNELYEALDELAGWEIEDGKLHKNFEFSSFGVAMGWMMAVAFYADKLDHHPDWSNSYNKIEVHLITHDLGAISTFDIELAGMMEDLAAGF